jgi:hypothetical protein
MKAQLKRLHSPDVHDLRAFVPETPGLFSLFVQAMIGSDDDDSFESFDLIVCSPDWLLSQADRAPVIGWQHLIMARYDYDALFRAIQDFCETCEGATWSEVATKVGRLGRWEFFDYVEHLP